MLPINISLAKDSKNLNTFFIYRINSQEGLFCNKIK